MVHQLHDVLGITAVLTLLATPLATAAPTDPLDALLAEVRAGDGGMCRGETVRQRIEEWQAGPREMPAFASVAEIMTANSDVDHLIEAGCNAAYIRAFRDCTQRDNPQATHIVPRGVVAESDDALAALIRGCLAALDAQGLSPE